MSQISLYNDDCLEVMKTLSDNSIDAIITDPPYGVNFKNDFYDDSEELVLSVMPQWYEQWFRILKEDSYLFLFVGVKTLHHWIQCGIDAGFTYKNIIATRSFNNGSPTPRNNFGFQFQPIIVFSKGKGKKLNEVDFIPTSAEWFKDKRNKNPKPFTYQYPNWIKTEWAFATEKRASKNIHPNEKNVKLLKFLVEVSTNENDVIFEPFMGSGSLGVACKQTNRDFIGCELDTDYFNIAKDRIAKEYENDRISEITI